MEENREIEIDLRKIFAMLKKKLAIIVLVTIIGGIAAGCFTNFFITPQYTATVKLHAWSNSDNIIGSTGSITQSEYEASKMLVNTYLVVVKSDTLLEKVAAELNNGITAEEIGNMMSCAQIEDTVAFRISITSPDKELAKEIANTIADTCPDVIVKILKVGGVEIIDYAKTPKKPSSPSLKKNTLVGAMVGFIISFAVFFIKELFDTRVKDEDDLNRDFDIPIIGTIPRLVPATDKPKEESSSSTLTPPQPSITFNDKEGK